LSVPQSRFDTKVYRPNMTNHFFTIRAATFAASLIVLFWLALLPCPSASNPAIKPAARELFGKLPLRFEANRGQAHAEVGFLARGVGYDLSLTPTAAVLEFHQARQVTKAQKDSRHTVTKLRMELAGANRKAHTSGAEPLPGRVGYFLGNDPRQWRADVPTYAKVHYEEVYPGIDLVYYGNQRQLEYDFVLAAGADPGAIRLQFSGARSLRINAAGDLVIATGAGELRQQRPYAYQEIEGERRTVTSRFVLEGQTVKFAIGAYDASQPLVIDPVLSYATLLGGALVDTPEAIAVDAQGNVYVTGSTYYRDLRGTGADFPTTAGAIRNNGQPPIDNGTYVFVSKLNPSGTALIYSAIIGGTKGFLSDGFVDLENRSFGIAVDEAGAAYVTGFTHSLNFPTTPGALQPTSSARLTIDEAFVFKLNPAGSALGYSTLLGEGDAGGQAIAVDRTGQAWVTGYARYRAFPTTANAWQQRPQNINSAGFVAKLAASGGRLLYASYLSSGSLDTGLGIALDAVGAAYVTGWTMSSCLRPDSPPVTPFPTTTDAFQRDIGTGCVTGAATSYAFATKFAADGAVIYSTLIRGASGNAIAVDGTGAAYVAGRRVSGLPFPVTPGAFQTQPPAGSLAQSGFVTKLNPAGDGLVYSTYFSGSVGLFGNLKLAVDAQGRACLTGAVSDATFVATTQDEPFGTRRGAFVTRFNAVGTALDYSVVLGDTYTGGRGIAVDSHGEVYVTGTTSSPGFPVTSGAFQQRLAGDDDAFILKVTAMRPVASVSAASYLGTALAGDSIVAAFGQDMALMTVAATASPLPTTLGGVTVMVRDALGVELPAPLFFVSPGQINYLIPPEAASGAATVTVMKDGLTASGGGTQIAPVAPGLFTANSNGRGVPAALALYLKPDGSQRYAPAAQYDETSQSFVAVPLEVCVAGEQAYLVLFGTGLRHRSSLASVSAKVAGVEAPVIYAGAQGGLVGLDQINVQLPRGLCARGETEVALTVDGQPANVVKIFIK
jgi:uncharacterized protein (TIGR03437 family)